MQAEYVFVGCVIRVQQCSVGRVFIHLLIGRKPPVAVFCHDDVVHALVIHGCQSVYGVVALVQYVSSVGGPDDNSHSRLGQAYHRIAAQQVRMFGIRTEHVNLPSVVAAHAAALCPIPKEALAVLHHIEHLLRGQQFAVRKFKALIDLSSH